jgi:flagellin-like hook-associated protein FlgL
VVDAASERHKAFATYATQAIGDIQNVDAAQALTQLNSDQAVLQASYAAIGRMTSLSIIDYLK